MRKLIIWAGVLFVSLSVCHVAFGDTTLTAPADLFRQASAAYRAEDFDRAVELYESILTQGQASGPLFYNLGNAYMKKAQLGKAVLSYERAQQYMPRDPDLRTNAKYVFSLLKREELEAPKFFRGWTRSYFTHFTVDELTILIFVFFFLTGAIYYLGLYMKWPSGFHLLIIVLSTVFLFVHGAGFYLKVKELTRAAIVLEDTDARFEPLRDATVHYRLNEGEKILVIKKDVDWLKIERKDKKQGWIPVNTAEAIQ